MRGSAVFRTGVAPGGALAGPWVRNSLWTRARAVPSLDLRFADNKSLVDATTGAQLVTHTRASSGTYVGSDGVLRSAVTNLLLWSEEFDNASWANARSSITSNTIVAPDGTLTGDKLVEDTTAANTHITRPSPDPSYVTGTTYTYSVFAQAAERTFLQLRVTAGATFSASFNLSTGVASQATAGTTPSVTDAGNGWYRCAVTFTATATAIGAARIGLMLNETTASYTGDGTSGIYLWGAQLEQSATVGEYIPTTSTINSAPRFDHNPTSGESLGLLVEEARTNSFEWSNSATQNETWSSVGTSLNLASGQSDPAGGTAGIRATDANSASGGTSLQRTSLANLTASTTVTCSIWLKPIDCPNNIINLIIFANTTTDSINANFSVSGTAITAVSTSTNGTGVASGASFEVFPNGWYRCQLTGVPSTVTMADVRARITLGTYQRAIGTARFDWYGAQLESGAFATSYIPTSGTAATRAADVASITGSNFSSWYRQDEGTVFVNGITPPNRANFPSLNTLHDGTSNNRLLQYVFTSGYFSAARVGSVPQGDNTAAVTPTDGSAYKVASAFAVNNSVTAVNGVTGSVDTLCLMPTALNTLAIGAEWNNANIVNSTIRRLTFWPTRLSNEVLQRITQ
jgi:hypothetical protein